MLSRRYGAMIIEDNRMLALIALLIDVHHQYLLQIIRILFFYHMRLEKYVFYHKTNS